MKVLTFSGTTPAEALKKAQEAVGDDAMLIETRQLQKKSLGQSALYEIVIGIDENALMPQKVAKKSLQEQKSLTQKSSDVLFNISEAAKQISKISEVTQETPSLTKGKSQEPQELKDIKKEISKLGDKV